MNHRWLFYISALSSTLLSSCSATDSSAAASSPPEIGAIHWETDYPTALASAKKSSKPIFALFQEVPG